MRNIGKRDQLAWKHVELIRKRWNGRLVVKGILPAADARMRARRGVDGVHRLQPWRPAARPRRGPLRALPEIAAGRAA